MIKNENHLDYKNYLGLNKDLLKKIAKNQDDIIELCCLDCTRQTFANYVNGSSLPTIDILIKLAQYCDCTIDELILPRWNQNGNCTYGAIRKVARLNTNGSITPVIYENKETGEKKYREYDVSDILPASQVDYFHYNVIELGFDSSVLFAKKGSILVTDFVEEAIDFSKEKDEIYVLLQDTVIVDKVREKNGKKEYYKESVKVVYPSIIKRIKNELGVTNIKSDIFSYIDRNGVTQFSTARQFENKTLHSRIVRIIRDL